MTDETEVMADAIAERLAERLARPPKLVSVKEAAGILGMGERSVYDLIERDVIPSLTVGLKEGSRRIEMVELERYIRERREAAA